MNYIERKKIKDGFYYIEIRSDPDLFFFFSRIGSGVFLESRIRSGLFLEVKIRIWVNSNRFCNPIGVEIRITCGNQCPMV